MKKSILLLTIIAALASFLPVASNAATLVYDLKADWSDTQNPNGAWSFHDYTGALLSNDPFPWAYSCETLEAIARASEAIVVPGTLELGDIFVRPGSCGVTVRWTAPAKGTINVSGNLWGCHADWTVTHSGSALSGGSAIAVTRSAPYAFSSGSGGASALQNIAVQAGDQIEIGFTSFVRCFDFDGVGLNFTITLTTDTVDPVNAIENLALTVVEMNLQNGIENSLDSKLDAAVNALIDANFNNDGAACNSLAAFISAVEVQRGKKITSAQADQLIASAQQIKVMLNCGN
jgi:hypothetical protein